MPKKANQKVAPTARPAETSPNAQPLAETDPKVKKRALDLNDAEDVPGKKVLTYIDVMRSEAD